MGALLLLIYINDLVNSTQLGQFVLFQVNNYISSKQLYFYFWHTTFQSKYIG